MDMTKLLDWGALFQGMLGQANQRIASGINLWSTLPGTQPGTSNSDLLDATRATNVAAIDQSPYRQQLIDQLNQLGRYSPTATGLVAQMAENDRALAGQSAIARQTLTDAQNSPLIDLAKRIRTNTEGTLARLDTASANATTQNDALQKRMEALDTETQGYFRGVRDNPNILGEQDLQRLAARYQEAAAGTEAANNRQIDAAATARGLAPEAVAALRMQAQTARQTDAAAARRDLEIANVANSAARADEAAKSLGTLGNMIESAQGQIGLGYGNLGNELEQTRNAAATTGFSQEQATTAQYVDAIKNAQANLQDLFQPENVSAIGAALDAVNKYNTAMRSGSFADQAAASNALMQALFGEVDSRRQHQAAEEQARATREASWIGGTTDLTGRVLGGYFAS